jgi:hypothetical protein
MATFSKALRAVPCALLVAGALAPAAAAQDRHAGVASRPAARIPSALVGMWSSAGGAAEIIYDFRRDGTYRHAGVLLQQRESGTFSFQIGARGTVTVRGRSLVLRPRSGFQQLRDPDDPSSNYRRPISRRPERYRWAVSGFGASATLSLTNPRTGLTVEYERQ